MADINIDFTQAKPTFTPNPFTIRRGHRFTVKVTVPDGYNQPTFSATPRGMTHQKLTDSGPHVYQYEFDVNSATEATGTLEATTCLGCSLEEKSSSGTIDVSNGPVED